MTKEELKALVASKLEGQGNQTDISGALSVVLNELIDEMGGKVNVMEIDYDKVRGLSGRDNVSKEELLSAGIDIDSVEEYTRARFNGVVYPVVSASNGMELTTGVYIDFPSGGPEYVSFIYVRLLFETNFGVDYYVV